MRHYVKKRIHKGIDGQKTYVLRETMGRTHYGVIKNHNYEGANDRRKQFYRGSTLPEILHTGWPVGNSPTSIKVLRFPPIYMGLGRYLPAILYTRLQDRTEALLEESDRRARDKGIRREELTSPMWDSQLQPCVLVV